MTIQLEDNMYLSPVATSGAQTATAFEYELEQNSVQEVEVHVVGRTSSGASYGGRLDGTVKRATGNASVVGQTAGPVNADAALSLCAFAIDASGASVRVRVTGVITQDITWWAVLKRVAYWADE